MRIEILGTESLGVRGLSCIVEVNDHKIVIDPGLALGYTRHGLLPHPAQVAVGERVRQKILNAVGDATDVVFSHLHGDHVPLVDANPYQMPAQKFATICRTRELRFWVKGNQGLSKHMRHRLESLRTALDNDLPNAEGRIDGDMRFSLPVPHGQRGEHMGMVMMTRIEEGEVVFVHASDIQLLEDATVSCILEWQPTIVLASGPPLYLPYLSKQQRKAAQRNALRLANGVDTLILDHHLLRSEGGRRWLDTLAATTGNNIICAADFMGRRRTMLEAWRQRLYTEMPVPEGWHEAYARGEVDTKHYQLYISMMEEGT